MDEDNGPMMGDTCKSNREIEPNVTFERRKMITMMALEIAERVVKALPTNAERRLFFHLFSPLTERRT